MQAERSVPQFGPIPNPDRDYMQDGDIRTVGEAIEKMRTEDREHYRRAGEPLGYLSPVQMLDWVTQAVSQ